MTDQKSVLPEPDFHVRPSIAAFELPWGVCMQEQSGSKGAYLEDTVRGLLCSWQPIESAPKDVCTEFDGWNGERVTNVSWGWPDYHPKEKRCWIRSVYETGYGWISEEVHGLTHWMPLPAPPSQEGAT